MANERPDDETDTDEAQPEQQNKPAPKRQPGPTLEDKVEEGRRGGRELLID